MAFKLSDLEREIDRLPPLSEAVNEAIAIFNSDYVDYDLIESKISKDPSLTVSILKVANSPFYGFSGKISNIKHACMLLGMHITRNIVLAAGVMTNFQKDKAGGGLNLNAQWQHSESTAVVSQLLAKTIGIDEAEAFTAGLLHDIGKMVLDVFFTDDYKPVLNYWKSQKCDLKSAEEKILGFNHSIVGARVAAHWRLPELIVNSCEYHHNPLAQEASVLAQVTYVANVISHNSPNSKDGGVELSGIMSDVLKVLNLDDSAIEQLLVKLGEMSDFEDLLFA